MNLINISIILILIIFVIIILCYIGSQQIFKVYTKERVSFVSKTYMEKIINGSYYFERMNKYDLIARNINSKDSYKKLYKEGLHGFTDNEKNILINLTSTIDDITENKNNIHNISWKFAKQNIDIENGWPHTLGDVIILSNKFFTFDNKIQLKVILHEKIHVYQRLYPLETNKLICDYWNFKIINRFENIEMARSNPDIDNYIYSNIYNKIMIQLYNSEIPNGIEDSSVYLYINKNEITKISHKDTGLSSVITQYEHPYEIMATLLPEILINNYDDKSIFVDNTKIWCSKYL